MKNLLFNDPNIPVHGRAAYNITFTKVSSIKNKIVLDIGCGYGWFELFALKSGVKKIVALEISEEDLGPAKNNISDKRAVFDVGSAIDLPFDDKSFDTVFSWEVLEHIPRGMEQKMFFEVQRVLKDGGEFYLSTPLDTYISKLFDPAWWLIGHRHYSPDRVSDFATKAGFEVKDIERGGSFWEIININSILFFKWVFRRKPLFWDYINKKRDLEYPLEKGLTSIFLRAVKI